MCAVADLAERIQGQVVGLGEGNGGVGYQNCLNASADEQRPTRLHLLADALQGRLVAKPAGCRHGHALALAGPLWLAGPQWPG